MRDLKECIDQCVAETTRLPPRPPAGFILTSVIALAGLLVRRDAGLGAWMRDSGLDPEAGPDALLAMGVALAFGSASGNEPEGDPIPVGA